VDLQDQPQSVAFCRVTQQGLLRLLSNTDVMQTYGVPPLTNKEAWQMYEQLRGDFRIIYLDEPPGIETVWRDLGCRDTASTKLWMDAYLAAFAQTEKHDFLTVDADFTQFQKLELLLLHS